MERTRLAYTAMWVPTTELRVTHATPIPGGGISAVVKQGTFTLGVITIENGHPTLEMTAADRATMEHFADRCRTADGEPVPQATVWQQLVMERLYAEHITRVEGTLGCVAVRAVHTTGTITLHLVADLGPDGHIDPAVFTPTVEHAEAWVNNQWMPVRPQTMSEPCTDRITLPHTGIRIPAWDRAWIETNDDGPVWSATVWINQTRLGRIIEDGQGGVELHCASASGRTAWEMYALMCCNTQGAPLTSGELVDALVVEHTTNQQLQDALRHRRYLVRLTTASGGPGLIEIPHTVGPYPDYDHAREAALNPAPHEDTVSVELWTGPGEWIRIDPPTGEDTP